MSSVFYDDLDWQYLADKCSAAQSGKMLESVRKEAEDAKDQAQ